MNASESLERLSKCLAKLPGVGRRSGHRMAFSLARDPSGRLANLMASLEDIRDNVRCCSLCSSLTRVNEDPCSLCSHPGRDDALMCVVEDPSDIVVIEESGGYHGRYHALLGRLSPMKGEGPEEMRLEALVSRLSAGTCEEVILALNTDVESDATASYLRDVLAEHGVRVSRLGFGLPAGSGIGYSDGLTLTRAFEGRQVLT